jgi:hypothetical protein
LLVDGRHSPHLSYPSLESSAPRVVTVRPQPRRKRAHSDRRRPMPSRELANIIPAPFPTSNQRVVSPWSPPRPFPGHPRRRLAGFWPEPPPVGARGPNCEVSILSEGLSADQGHICKIPNLSRDPGANIISNSTWVLLILVNCVENRRKFRKMQTQFFGFAVKNPTTFVILV